MTNEVMNMTPTSVDGKLTFLVFDTTNMLHRTFFVEGANEDSETSAGMAVHSALTSLNKYYKKFKPDSMLLGLDNHSWRKDYTASEQCVSKKPYKGNRRQNMTPAQAAKYERFLAHIKEFQTLLSEHTNIPVLAGERLEADDVIAGFAIRAATLGHRVIIVSTDSDYAQLLKYEGIQVFSPATDLPHSLSKWNDDAEFYLFCKCIRGDTSDNVQSAYPRVRTTRLEKAWVDPFERTQLMNERWVLNGTEVTVQQLYSENELLIDLTKQPDDIKELINQAIERACSKQKCYSQFFFMKFCAKLRLKRVIEQIDSYSRMLNKWCDLSFLIA